MDKASSSRLVESVLVYFFTKENDKIKYIDELYVENEPVNGSFSGYVQDSGNIKYLSFEESEFSYIVSRPTTLFFDSEISGKLKHIADYLQTCHDGFTQKEVLDFYLLSLEEKTRHVKDCLDRIYKHASHFLKF